MGGGGVNQCGTKGKVEGGGLCTVKYKAVYITESDLLDKKIYSCLALALCRIN